MDYIKYNCFDIAVHNNELLKIGNQLQHLSHELTAVLNSLDSQIKSYESLQQSLAASNSDIKEVVMRIFNMHSALDQIIDVYYMAENNALRLVEELPVGLVEGCTSAIMSGVKNINPINISTASISRGDLVMEDWLAQLVYKFGIRDNKE